MNALHLCVFLCFVFAANAQSDKVFRVTTPEGETIFTDNPSGNAVPITLPQGSEMASSPITPLPKTAGSLLVKQHADSTHYQMNVVSPKPEQTIRSNIGQVNIQTSLHPKVQGVYTLHLNDQVMSQNSGLFRLNSLDRGVYTFYIEFALKSGKILASTSKQTFYLHQASALNRPK
ncbi:hypothetical protein [Paraglaciecola polaris]|uniref:DUF4124 domain-containing protein n=1 Tax=Paraglaciecola polaris LMG 21857 TaxID=1129793 RepID=K6Z8U5_9ALTE|nr:hypothetical protein [Paraglaciecola polaris]GAC32596.1 hypothetical protein GPLA_1682 [Paraglaciecola polaris LMG 21857]|tara:strand:- start:1719 stop:2243 length:525 start_codon:yes stop_codon:yes gene_type:complete